MSDILALHRCWKRIFSLVAVLAAMVCSPQWAAAQTNSFQVDNQIIIDDFETGAQRTWTSQNDTGATFTPTFNDPSSAGLLAGSKYAMKIDFNFSNGAWGVMKNDLTKVFSAINLQGRGTSIRVYYRGQADPAQTLVFNLTDARDGNTYSLPAGSVNKSSWTPPVEKVISGYQPTDVLQSNGKLPDLASLSSISFRVDENTAGGAGSLWVDKIETFGEHQWKIYDPDISTETAPDSLASTITTNGPPVAYGTTATAIAPDFTVATDPANSAYGKVGQITFKNDPGFVFQGVAFNLPGTFRNFSNGGPYSLNAYSYLHLRLRRDNNNAPKIDVKVFLGAGDANANAFVYPLNEIGNDTDWHDVMIPLYTYEALQNVNWGLVMKQNSMPNIFLQVESNPSSNFNVYVDQIDFVTDPSRFLVVEDFEKPSTSWGWAPAPSGKISVGIGYEGAQSLRYDYNFNDSPENWRAIYRNAGMNVTDQGRNAVHFWMKSGGANEDLDVKLTDNNNITYRAYISGITDTKGVAKEFVVKYDRFVYFRGSTGVKPLALNAIKSVEFGVNSTTASASSSGTIYIDNVGLVKVADYNDTARNAKIIKSFTVDNNPFSPGKSARGDKATFRFTLGEQADAQISIFNLQGKEIYKSESVLFTAGDQFIQWDGKDGHGQVVRNGLYFYNFKVKGISGTVENLKHVIGVVR